MNILPCALTGVVLHDLIRYGLFPKEYCEDSLFAILAGTTSSQTAWGHYLGSDIFHEAAFIGVG